MTVEWIADLIIAVAPYVLAALLFALFSGRHR